MEYNIDEKNCRIEMNGSKEEVKKFTRCLVEIINKNYVEKLDLTQISNEPLSINPTRYQRIYLMNDSLIYLPNFGDEEDKKSYFNIIKENYEKAKEKFENFN